MVFRKAVKTDINGIMDIINQAKDYFKKEGIDQWQNGYPNSITIQNDIDHEYGYVLLENNVVVGTVAVIFDREKTYDCIYDGNWISKQKEYAVIHRIAIDDNKKGLGLSDLILESIEILCLNNEVKSIRVDTQKDNISMQKWLEKNNFKYCGIIYLEDRSKRLAFEKILES